jgi:hypothetical protein
MEQAVAAFVLHLGISACYTQGAQQHKRSMSHQALLRLFGEPLLEEQEWPLGTWDRRRASECSAAGAAAGLGTKR